MLLEKSEKEENQVPVYVLPNVSVGHPVAGCGPMDSPKKPAGMIKPGIPARL
jgi:hypothetical protein